MTKNKASALAPMEYEDTGIDLFKFIVAFLVRISHSGMLYTYIGDAEGYIINPNFDGVMHRFYLKSGKPSSMSTTK